MSLGLIPVLPLTLSCSRLDDRSQFCHTPGKDEAHSPNLMVQLLQVGRNSVNGLSNSNLVPPVRIVRRRQTLYYFRMDALQNYRLY
jgi:hypothetical protein